MDNYPHDCIQHRKGDVLLVKYPPSKKHDPAYSTFRSTIFYKDELVSVSPSKSISYDDFKNKYSIQNCVVEEFVEGTMIHLWYGNDRWNIATRSVIDAQCGFETDKTFSEMFYECMAAHPLELNSDYCYSLVLQHPDNNIITPIETMKLYVIGKYKIVEGRAVEYPETTNLSPRTFEVSSYEEAESLAQTLSCKGLMLKCNGERAKIKRTVYYEMENFKGCSSFQLKYLSMRNTPEVFTFLHVFPWYTKEYIKIEQDIHKLSQTVYHDYVKYYIRKQRMPLGYPYKKILYDVHSIYFTIRPLPITIHHVSTMVQHMNPYQLIRFLQAQKTSHKALSPPGMIL
jgi:hypothetical protein